MVISFSLMNLMFNLGVIRKGEIKSWSLLGIFAHFPRLCQGVLFWSKKSRALSIGNHFPCPYDSNVTFSMENLKADHS